MQLIMKHNEGLLLIFKQYLNSETRSLINKSAVAYTVFLVKIFMIYCKKGVVRTFGLKIGWVSSLWPNKLDF